MKSVSDLAIFSKKPAFDEKLHVGRPNIPDETAFLEMVKGVPERRWLTNNGPLVNQFEEEIARFLGVKHAIPICNGTVALEIAIRALKMEGEVIVPSFTFVAIAHSLKWQGIEPVFCDIKSDDFTIDPAKIEELITERTTGIVGVHLWGRACDAEALEVIAKERGLKLLFDAAHSFACSHGAKMVGSFGAAEVLSFHATKFINTLEGGAITTNDDELAKRIRLIKNFGFSGMDNVIYLGTNGKMNEISAAMGLCMLAEMERLIEINRSHYHLYLSELDGVGGLIVRPYEENNNNNYQYVVVMVDEEEAGLSRDQLLKVLHGENIIARRYFYPSCHNMEPYRTLCPEAGKNLPETELASNMVICLPTGSAVSADDIKKVCEIIRLALSEPERVKEGLG
ncbi:MAG: aminotransferase class I/II-fold pyridoxal phosphate-dependent enzyme [Actinomycetota bacterium]|nr:aminotransferase class I/II-fold pyridoxal phosphate-dependent enzyme [Actinomycetota bacterium]